MNYKERLNKLMEEMNYQKGMRVRTDKASKIAKMINKESYKEITGYNICPVCKKKYPAKDESKYKKGDEHMCLDCGNKIQKNIEFYKAKESVNKTPQDEIDKITMDVPLLTRILEYFNENKMDDVKLHVILTNIINESKKTSPLNINNYENIINGGKNE